MSVWDGFKFWLGKALSELAIGVGILVMILVAVIIVVFWQEWRDRKRRQAIRERESAR